MTDRKKTKRKKLTGNAEEFTSKSFMKIAKYMRFNLPVKKATLAGMKVDYFTGNKAVSFLMQSEWSTSVAGESGLFQTRSDCVAFMQQLIDKDMIHRAFKIYKTYNDENDEDSKSVRNENEQQNLENDSENNKSKNSRLKTKRKYKLGMHDDQVFIDDAEIYVWVYDPPTVKQFLIGSLVLAIVIVCSLFPLWPSSFRSLAFYFSAASGIFIGIIMLLAVLKYIIFVIVWAVTRGEIHFWFLPNLSEDVGFIESFIPVYVIKRYKSNPEKRTNDDDTVNTEKNNDEKIKNLTDDKTNTNECGSCLQDDDEYELVSHNEINDNNTEHCKAE